MDPRGLLFVVLEFGLTDSCECGGVHVRLDEPCHCDCPAGTGIQSLLMLTKGLGSQLRGICLFLRDALSCCRCWGRGSLLLLGSCLWKSAEKNVRHLSQQPWPKCRHLETEGVLMPFLLNTSYRIMGRSL